MIRFYSTFLIVIAILTGCQRHTIGKLDPHPKIAITNIPVKDSVSSILIHTAWSVDPVYDELNRIDKNCILYTVLDRNGRKTTILYMGEFYMEVK